MPDADPKLPPLSRLLVLDAAYTLEMVKQRGMENSITCRDIDGYFEHVYSVHPFATMLTSEEWGERYGRPRFYELNDRHTVIEGCVGRFKALSWIFPLNFLIGQFLLFIQLLRLIRTAPIAVIRVGDPLYLGLMGLGLKYLSGRPLLIRVNGNNDKVREDTGRPLYPRFFRSERIEKAVEAFVFPRADIIAAPNQDNVDFAVRSGARADRTTIFRYGNLLAKEHLVPPKERPFDAGLFQRLGLEPGRYMLSIGRLQAVKFPQDTISVLAAAISNGHDVKLCFAGDGDMREELLAMAKRLNVEDRLALVGNQNQQDLAQLNAHAALVLSPLTGRALSESALGGTALVAYDLDWQGDLVRTGETGILVPFRDVEAFGAAACQLLADPDAAHKLGMAARERALAMLDPDRLNAHERDTYERLFRKQLPLPGV